jgi:hypothetical protein
VKEMMEKKNPEERMITGMSNEIKEDKEEPQNKLKENTSK